MVKQFSLKKPMFKKLIRRVGSGLNTVKKQALNVADTVSKGVDDVGKGVQQVGNQASKIAKLGQGALLGGSILATALAPEFALPLLAGAEIAGQGKTLFKGVSKAGEDISKAGKSVSGDNLQKIKPKIDGDTGNISFHS
jgi:uncharacterized membrane protein